MSSKQNDQAEALRQAIQDVTENKTETEEAVLDQDEQKEQTSVEIDILNLPPRNEVHKDSSKIRFKVNLSLLRFLFIVVLLLALAGIIVWFI
ncbi:hypothetical protein [Oceanobacillus neutriphilus]|uniref:Uncharacterized protein n=1 Tax=Oceanobacillus neutriphilus TaxID=531815 RepID=A0ABQ2NTY2_9BACI|nr:hypothetical protein [Oceanobacillus neutriphilus]GGP10431.1 hypothetical protein GCM10011346_18530 [Oceanobacillus neutriphilus]